MLFQIMVLAGIGGALLPLPGSIRCSPRVALGHFVMAVAMAGMLVPREAHSWTSLVGGLTLVGMSVWVTDEQAERSLSVPCAVDMTAMGLMMLFVMPAHSSKEATPSQQIIATGLHRHSSEVEQGSTTWLGPFMLALWCAAAAVLVLTPSRKDQRGRMLTFGSTAVMIAATVPIIA